MSERTATLTREPAKGGTITTRAVTYRTRRFQQHYGLVAGITRPGSEVEAVRVALQINDGELGVQDLTHGTQSTYRRVEALRDKPFLAESSIVTGTYNEVGLVRYYVWHDGNVLPGGSKRRPTRVAIVGLRAAERGAPGNGDAFGFVRIYDFLGEQLPPLEALETLLYSRGGTVLHPGFEPELVFEAGTPAALLGRRPGSVPDRGRAAVAYISPLGAAYHMVSAGMPEGQWIDFTWTDEDYTEQNTEVEHHGGDLVEGRYVRMPFDDIPFLKGFLRFYSFAFNPDPKGPGVPVNRIAVLGLTRAHRFGFVRVFDSLSLAAPPALLQPLPFDFFTSHANSNGYGYLNRELVLEAGSPVALIEEEAGGGLD